ncbi:MAG: hypothetical protein JWN83_1622 [Chitinophagaceae bacterium]|nr:hypothetical protein [Chitinophagaceae bacterium]
MKAYRIQTFFLVVIFISFGKDCLAQKNDSAILKHDSLQLQDSVNPNNYQAKSRVTSLDSLLKNHKYLNTAAASVFLAAKEKTKPGKEFLFYLLGIAILLLALFKVFYTRYFNNIFRVFFNTSLRQNQLADLLLQAKLPSLIFNIFFVISGGLYAWLLLNYYHLFNQSNNYILIGLSILFVALIYFGKFLSLKLIGWLSGMDSVTDQYIFVIFLINKILGIVLIPFIILLAFAPANWLTAIIITSFFVIGVLFLLRYLRSYGLLQNQLKINVFHFLLYIIGMELLPIMLIYKLVIQVLI